MSARDLADAEESFMARVEQYFSGLAKLDEIAIHSQDCHS
jgi:hypothetical protein